MGATPFRLAVTVNVATPLPARTTVDTLPMLSDVCAVGAIVAAVVGATVHVTLAPLRGWPWPSSTVKPIDSVPPVSTESLSPNIPVIEPTFGPIESPPQATAPPNMAVSATGTNRRSSVMLPPLFGHDAVEYLAVSNHPELLSRHPLLHCRVRLEVARQLGQRIDLDAQRGDFGALVRELPPDRDPVRGAVLAAPNREGEQSHATGDPGNPRPRHKPSRWRPG